MVKHTLKILRCSRRKNFKVCLTILRHYALIPEMSTLLFVVTPLLQEIIKLFNKLQNTDENILSKDDSNILKVLLFVDHSLNDVKNVIHNFNKPL